MLIETHRAGAPFPHCGAAHGASGGPRAGPELVAVHEEKRDIISAPCSARVACGVPRARAWPHRPTGATGRSHTPHPRTGTTPVLWVKSLSKVRVIAKDTLNYKDTYAVREDTPLRPLEPVYLRMKIHRFGAEPA